MFLSGVAWLSYFTRNARRFVITPWFLWGRSSNEGPRRVHLVSEILHSNVLSINNTNALSVKSSYASPNVNLIYCLLECKAVLRVTDSFTFKVKQSKTAWPLKMNAHGSYKTSETLHTTSQQHIDEDWNVEQYRCEHLGSRVTLIMLQWHQLWKQFNRNNGKTDIVRIM